jgi:hypothetical protein
MTELAREANTLGALLEETRGVVGVALGTAGGQLRAVVGSVVDGDASAAVAAALTHELSRLGAMLGLGELGVASLKAPSAARVFARQAGAAVVIELDPKRPLTELETKLRTVAWAPGDEILDPLANRATIRQFTDPARSLGPPPRPKATPSQPMPIGASAAATTLPSQMKSVGSGPVFTGDLKEFSLPDLLEFLRNSHRTGLLMCTTPAGVGTIQLSRGLIIGADSPHALDLREHFVTHPEIDIERRRVFATLAPECFGDDLIEDVLIGRGLATPDEVERARTARIYSAFREMMVWMSGRFSFDPGVPIVTNPALALSAQGILMHLYQEQDEQDR